MGVREEGCAEAGTEGKGVRGLDGDSGWRMRGSGGLITDDGEDVFRVLVGEEFRGGEDGG